MTVVQQVNTKDWEQYVQAVRKHSGNDFEVYWNASIHGHVSAFIFHCFVDGISSEECSQKLLDRFEIIEKSDIDG